MIIGIDGNEANVEKKVGVSEFAYELLLQFALRKSESQQYRVYLKQKPLIGMPPESKNFRYTTFGPGKLWTQFALPLNLFLKRNRPNVFFTPSHYAPRFSPVPTVISIMDVSYLLFPELFRKSDLYQLQRWTKYSVEKSKKVITISNSSKNDIIKAYNLSPGRVSVVYPGIKRFDDLTPHIYSMSELQTQYGLSDKYLLFVGTLQPRKNISRLIEAFARLLKETNAKDVNQLVIVGKKGWLYEEILAAPKKFGIEQEVKFLDFVPDKDLPLLYKNALCFVCPSLYEGFGLPILEAMRYGCPVITSNVSSLPEAGGDACLYVDPTDVNDITEKIKKVLKDKKLREKMIERGREQVKKFSWEKAAKETLEILESVAR